MVSIAARLRLSMTIDSISFGGEEMRQQQPSGPDADNSRRLHSREILPRQPPPQLIFVRTFARDRTCRSVVIVLVSRAVGKQF